MPRDRDGPSSRGHISNAKTNPTVKPTSKIASKGDDGAGYNGRISSLKTSSDDIFCVMDMDIWLQNALIAELSACRKKTAMRRS